jgi:undecaprenyl-diphosphatase
VVALKALVDRPRPATALVYESSTSYPSGHALGVMAGVLGLAIAAQPLLRGRWRTPLFIAGAVIVIAIGVGRVVLNVHNPSDVLAGWALGYLWVLACLPVLGGRAGTAAPLTPVAETPAAPGTAP